MGASKRALPHTGEASNSGPGGKRRASADSARTRTYTDTFEQRRDPKRRVGSVMIDLHIDASDPPTWFQQPRGPDARWNPNLLPATRRKPRREPLQLVRTDRSTSRLAAAASPHHSRPVHLSPNPDPLTLARTRTRTLPTPLPRQVSPSLPTLTLQPGMAFGTGERAPDHPALLRGGAGGARAARAARLRYARHGSGTGEC